MGTWVIYKGKIIALSIMVIRLVAWVIISHILNDVFFTRLFLLFIPETLFAIWVGHLYDNSKFYSQRDRMTGSYNRHFVDAVFPRLLAKAERAQKKLSLLMVDLDNLKAINDQFGHKAGDTVIEYVCHMFNGSVRTCDFVARWGGDEFLIIAPDTDYEGALNITQRIEENMIAIRAGENISLAPSVSIGIAVYPDDGRTLDEMLQVADSKMYDNKRALKS